MTMGHSSICRDPTTHWDRFVRTCLPCPLKPGHSVTPNCGFDDNGGRHEPPHRECEVNTFNDGSSARCQTCTSCLRGYKVVRLCSSTTDTQCEFARSQTTEVPLTEATPSQRLSTFFSEASTTNQPSILTPKTTTSPVAPRYGFPWFAGAVSLTILTFMVLVLFACIIYTKWKRGQNIVLRYRRRSSFIKEGFSPLSAPAANDVESILSPHILSAPLQTVLDNLDVLEELVVLLDPESHGIKNTKHLASQCSFPSTWITYTYSMKDTKSPLKALLEAVTSRHPDWTVGHLAKLLRFIERNDAVAVLAKLKLIPIIM